MCGFLHNSRGPPSQCEALVFLFSCLSSALRDSGERLQMRKMLLPPTTELTDAPYFLDTSETQIPM